jgi:hypothetical protein
MSNTIYPKFLYNKYYVWYMNIVNTAKNRKLSDGNCEKHHIIPKSLGGDNSKENLVSLTFKEHILCHHLLTKFTENAEHYKMLNAYSFFMGRNNNNKRPSLTLRQAALARKFNSLSKKGENNPMFGVSPWNKGVTPEPHVLKALRTGADNWRANGGMEDTSYRSRISSTMTGKKKTPEHSANIKKATTGTRSHHFSGYYHTPFGKLTASTEIEDIIPNQLVRRWCKNPDKLIHKSSFSQNTFLQSLGASIVGKTFRDIGFWYEPL